MFTALCSQAQELLNCFEVLGPGVVAKQEERRGLKARWVRLDRRLSDVPRGPRAEAGDEKVAV